MIQRLTSPLLKPGMVLSGSRLLAARLLSLIVALGCLAMFLVALPARVQWLEDLATRARPLLIAETQLGATRVEWITGIFPQVAILVEIGVMSLYFLSAALIYWMRSNDWLALMTAAGLPSFALHITPTLNTWMEAEPHLAVVGILFKCLGLGLAFLFMYLFPNGYYAPTRMRLFLLGWIAWSVVWLMYPDSIFSFRDPFGISIASFWLLMLWWGTGIFSQIYRYVRVSSQMERQQAKYITFGVTIVVIGYSLYVPLRELMKHLSHAELAQVVFQMVAPSVFLLMVGAIPFTIALSILRYRLWDIDIIIHRTLIYGALTALLALIYFVGVILSQGLLIVLTGQRSTVAVTFSTLAVAALFSPLRARLQTSIDRRFFWRKYEAARALEKFSADLRDEVDLEQAIARLNMLVYETLEPERVSVWLVDKRKAN